MNFLIVNLILLFLIYIINAVPLYRMVYPSNYYQLMNLRRNLVNQINRKNLNLNNKRRLEDSYVDIPMQDVGLDEEEEEEGEDQVTRQTSHFPLYGIDENAPFPLPQFLDEDLRQLYYRLERSPMISGLFTIESVPHPNPLMWITPSGPYYYQMASNAQPATLRRFTIPIVQSIENFGITSFPDFSWQFGQVNDFFNRQQSAQRIPPIVYRNQYGDEVGDGNYDLIQIGNNNQNIRSEIQNGIIQIGIKDNEYGNTERPRTTTDYSSMETTTEMPDETTMFNIDDRIDGNAIRSLLGK